MDRDEPGVESIDFILKVITLWEYCRERIGKMNQNVCVSHLLYLIHAILTMCSQHDMPILQRRNHGSGWSVNWPLPYRF